MPVFIDQPDAFERICQVEREIDPLYCEDRFQEEMEPCCSFAGFKKAWGESVAKNPEVKEKLKDVGMTVNSNGAIYGADGWNRYSVKYSGEICFIRDLAINSDFVAKAQAAGFRII